jgi:hypothetical protein
MANGPMGGFMPTPAAPAQPPSVKLDSTAASRGTFNEFLRNMNGAMNPPLAPMVGANPMMAPAANIDIFNQPVQNFQFGGFADDTVGDTSGTFSVDDQGNVSDDFSIGGGGFGGTGGDEQSFVDALTDPASTSFDAPATDIFADDPSSATPMGLSMPSAQNFSTKATTGTNLNFDQNTLNEIKKEINNRNEVSISEEDNFFKDNKLTPAGQTELNKRNAEDLQMVMSGEVPASTYISADSASSILGDANILDLAKKTDQIDPFDIQPTFQNFGLPGVSGLTNVRSTRSTVPEDQARAIVNLVGKGQPTAGDLLQQNVLADRGRALGPTTFDDDLAGFVGRSDPFVGPDLDALRSDRATFDTIFDPDTYKGPRKDIPNVGMIGGRRDPKFTTADDTDPREDTLGVLPTKTLVDIERLSNVPIGQRRAGQGDDTPFFQGLGLPTFFDGIERFTRDRMASELAKGNVPEKNIVRDSSGLVIGIKDNFGNLMEGRDPNQQMQQGDDETPIIRKKVEDQEEKKDDDKPPNIIGGGDPVIDTLPPPPTVVASPFAPSSANIRPVTFDTGDLNKLIEMLTGVPARPVVAKQEGGLIKAVDDFLATGT